MQMQEWLHRLSQRGGWVSVAGAAFAGSMLPVIVFVKSKDLQLVHLPFAMAGGAAVGAMAAGILLLLDLWRKGKAKQKSP